MNCRCLAERCLLRPVSEAVSSSEALRLGEPGEVGVSISPELVRADFSLNMMLSSDAR